MLPEDAVVLLVHAHRVFYGERFAATRAEMAVEILDESKAITTQFKAVRAHPKTIFAGIEGVLAGLLRGRVAVGNHHLREGGAIEHRAILALVLIAEMVQRQSLAGIEANDKTPLLPLYLVAVHREAGAFRLIDLQRLDVLAEVCDAVRGVIALLGWQRPMAIFLDADHLHGIEIDDGAQALNWLGIAIVGRILAHKA